MTLRAIMLAVAVLLAAAIPASAQDTAPERREAAEDALAAAQRLADGRGIRTGRELTPALLEVARRRSALSRSDRATADSLLGRPTDPDDTEQTAGPYTVPEAPPACTDHFCVHWVATTGDAPDQTDGPDADSVPDYINFVMTTAEQAWAVEHTTLGWQLPKSDGTLGGDTSKTDIYIKDLNPGTETGLYGYANTDPPQSTRSQYGFVVLDNDYNAFEFPRYAGDEEDPLQVTIAHEYNHVLQFGYDIAQDGWMYESTATWMEDKVFPDVDDYLLYLPGWVKLPEQPITESANGKEYGSAVWNHWLDGSYGATVIRDAWAGSDAAENTVQNGGFAPKAYDAAIRSHGGDGFSRAFGAFAAATATWDRSAPDPFHEGEKYGSVVREGTLQPDGSVLEGALDHTAFALFNVAPSAADRLDFSAALPSGTAGYVALVGDDSTTVAPAVQPLDAGGAATVSLPGPGAYTRITAVVANTDVQHTGFDADCGDWNWSHDRQAVRVSLSARATGEPASSAPSTPPGSNSDCSPAVTPAPDPTATPTPTPTATPAPPPPPPPPAASLTLSRSSTRIRTVARTGVLALFARTNKAGRLGAKSTVDRATARRLKIGRRTTSTGTGRRTATSPGRFKLNVRLTRKARAALKRQTRRTLRMKVRVTLVPVDGTSAVTRTISLLLRP